MGSPFPTELSHRLGGEAKALLVGLPPKTLEEQKALASLLFDVQEVVEAAQRLRDDPHHITFNDEGWAVEHSLFCRVHGMLDCEIDRAMRVQDDLGKRGRFTVAIEDGAIRFGLPQPGDPAADLVKALALAETRRAEATDDPDAGQTNGYIALAERMEAQAKYSWGPQSKEFLRGVRLDHLDAAGLLRAAGSVLPELDEVDSRAREVLAICEGILESAKGDSTSTTEGAVYLAADVVSRLTGQQNASELVKAVYG